MFEQNRICKLFNIKYPIIQGGMVWCSGWELASAVSNAGGLGLIGAGSMQPELLREHIQKTKRATKNSFGVNVPLLKRDIGEFINVIIAEKIKVVFTSAGNPNLFTQVLKDSGCTVFHVVSGAMFAQKSELAGVDGIVAEGFEAGGHNGKDETSTFVLIPSVRQSTQLPLIAAGGMYSGKSLLAAMALGAEGIQIGSRFAISTESSAHINYKLKVAEIKEGETRLTLKKLVPVRMITNELYKKISAAENKGADAEILQRLMGHGRSRLGIFEGDLMEGELEIGQVSALLNKIETVSQIIEDIIQDYQSSLSKLTGNSLK